jgi:hypothetical protein
MNHVVLKTRLCMTLLTKLRLEFTSRAAWTSEHSEVFAASYIFSLSWFAFGLAVFSTEPAQV